MNPPLSTRRISILGSTGSIGTQALEVLDAHRDEFEVVALATGRNGALLAEQAAAFGVPADRARLAGDDPTVLEELASLDEADVVLNAVVGFAGLPATLATLRAGKRLALANKESLIAGGPVVARVREAGGGSAAGLVGKTEGGMHGLLREFGIAQRDDLADVDQRISDLEHRIRLLEERPAG